MIPLQRWYWLCSSCKFICHIPALLDPELTQYSLYTTIALCWASWKVIQLARRSARLHKTPAYILFSDPHALNKWGFLYIQFRASAYYFIIPIIGYYLVKGAFIGLGQKSGIAQAIGFILIEAAALIAASVMRPWMDKKMNSFNISIAVVNFLNAICLLIFTDVFGQVSLHHILHVHLIVKFAKFYISSRLLSTVWLALCFGF